MKTNTYHTPHAVAVRGFQALLDKLGPGGAIQFIHQYETGAGNYTVERRALLKAFRLEHIQHSQGPKARRTNQ